MHLVKQLLVGSTGIETKNGIDAAARTHRRLVIIDPLYDLLEPEFVITIEARTYFRFLKQ